MLRSRGRNRNPFAQASCSFISTAQTLNALAASRCQVPSITASLAANFTSRREYWAHGAGAISNLQTVMLGFYISPSTFIPAGSAAYTIEQAIEYPQDTLTRVTWSAANQKLVGAGLIVTSDVCPVSIPAGAKFWVRTYNVNAANPFPLINLPAASTVLGVDDGNIAANNFVMGGTIPATSGATTFGPAAIFGNVAANNARGAVIIGDSLSWGTGDDTTVSARHGSGWVSRMLDAQGIPWVKAAVGGASISDFVSSTVGINNFFGTFGYTDFISQFGINDLRLGRTKAQIEADIQTAWALSNVTGKHKWQGTIGPRSTSSDSWATTGNQTPTSDGNMADLTGLNADIRAGLANSFGFIELADAAMSARDSNIHKAPPAGTTDGTHYNSTRAALIAGLLALP